MDYRNAQLFNNLKPEEQRECFLLLVGLHFFINKKKTVKHTRGSLLKIDDRNPLCEARAYSIRLEIIDDDIRFVGYDAKSQSVTIVKSINSKETIEEVKFIDLDLDVSDSLVNLILDAVQSNVSIESKPKEIELLHFLKPNDYFYRFVLGSGVSNSIDYRGVDWEHLKNRFELAIDNRYGVMGLAHDISNTAFNTNYGSFQLVKDIQHDDYESIVRDMIENLRTPDIFDDTTLSAVVDVLSAQVSTGKKQFVVTFNYDDLLETLWELKDGSTYTIARKSNDFKDLNESSNLTIYHTHGYASKRIRDRNGNIDLDGIVLTTEEYIDAYASQKSNPYHILFEHLNETCCFVGNSITDYEEQKVLKKHIDKYPSSFHYAFLQCDDFCDRKVLYKTIFLLKIGIIPLWYEHHRDYKEILKLYARRHNAF